MKTSRKSLNPYRLEKGIDPVLYDLELEPDLSRFTFQGKETITLKAAKPFSKIVLHALEIKIHKAELRVKGSKAVPAQSIRLDAKMETAVLEFGRKFKSGSAELYLEFEGSLNDKMHGFYRTSYEVRGEKRWGAATQFEATDARRAFPCWDEPDRKAKFKVTLRVPKNLTALSNMPVTSEKNLPGTNLKQVTYGVSPIMSTYLLAIVVADLECVEGRDKNGVTIRVWTTPGKKEQGRFGLQVAQHTLPYFAEWFGIPYALPKLDQVALPDFASGAMENWGLVTYRETALLVDEKNSSAAARQRVAEVVDHELAHQWFGNLVTMEWWTDLWLNEGFASYMGPKAVDHQFPEWKVWDQYIVVELLTALRDDSLRNTHPIEIPVKNPAEIREIFDPITYSKGSVVNRMLEHYLGESNFQKGLRRYLKKFAYQNAKTQDLWQCLEEVSGKPVKKIMASYTEQGGYPLLSVDLVEKNGREVLEIEQKRFLFDGQNDKENLSWSVPITLTGRNYDKTLASFMNQKSASMELPPHSNSWIKLNPGQSGYYRVSYPEEVLAKLTGALESGDLPIIDTLGIIDDAWALARAGEIQTSAALDILDACQNQKDYNIWLLVAGGLAQADALISDEAKSRLAQFALTLLNPIAQEKGWEKSPSDSHSEVLLRSLLIQQMGHYGDSETIREAQKRFQSFVSKGDLEPNLRGAVYSITARYGGEKEFENFVKIYKESPLQEERVRVLRALTRFREPRVVQKVLNFALTPEVRNQDAYVVLAGFGGNPQARAQNWAFVKEKWPVLTSRYKGSSATLLGRILDGSAGGFLTQKEYKDVETFFKKHPVAGAERTMKQCLEAMRCHIRWAARDCAEIELWLAINVPAVSVQYASV